jgi:hypothetical protein
MGVLAKGGLLRPADRRSKARGFAQTGRPDGLGIKPDDVFDRKELQLGVGKCLEQRSILFHDPSNHRYHIVLGDGMKLRIFTYGVGDDVVNRPAFKCSSEL